MKWLNDYRIMLVLVGLVVSGFLGTVSVSSAVEYIWTQKADMPTPRWNLATCAVDGKIYAVGGEPSEGGPGSWRLSAMEEYDPATNTWTKKTDIPTARVALSASAVGGKVYAIGGDGAGGSFSRVEEYDPATNTWARKADMPTPRWMLSTCVVDGKIYAIGGYPPDIWVGLTTVEVYEPETDIWTRKADMPLGVALLNARVVRGRIYAIGGRPDLKSRAYVQEYDPSTDTWTHKADMLAATSQMASGVLGDKIAVIGGWLWSLNDPYKTVQIYDPQTNMWTREADAPFLRACCSSNIVNNRIYVIGGTDRPHPCPATSTVFEFGPLLDFNWDGIVDGEDVSILIDNWHTDNLFCDIDPLPFGDGIVDTQDLTALAEHLFEEVFRMELVGYWKLDELEGDIAYNSIDDNHGILSGNPTRQPESGQVAGALDFDGIDDYVETEFILNPGDGVFSAIAWIKGGAPGQAILSQANSAIWLGIDSVEGFLTTELKGSGRFKGDPLSSQATINDGKWHHVGFVWDDSHRHLYVDGVEVARDAAPLSSLEDAYDGLYFGAGKALDDGTFFSGLIDDVRIYNKALSVEEITALAQ